MSTLHIVRSSGFNTNALTQCLSLVSNADSILLMDDGCYNINHPLLIELLGNRPEVSVSIIDNHAEARAQTANKLISTITLADMLELIFNHNNSITWS